ncbi:MAG: hypothetical protein ABIJ56_00875 [Pseudomonadota bacterium]
MNVNRYLLGCFFVLALAGGGCAKKFIPNTTIKDNPFNREVVKFCEQYRLAVEGKNTGKLLMMASADYYEDGGTPTGEDDFDYTELRDVLVKRFEKIKTIRHDIKYRHITVDGKYINVDYTWSGSYQIEGADGQDHWFRKKQDNRLVLVLDDDSFKIVNGM